MAKSALKFEVYLFDARCQPLKVAGINVELFDSSNNQRLDKKASRQIGTANEWGAQLTWNAVHSPVEMYFAHAQYQYSGQAVVDINGFVPGRLDLVLHKLATTFGGQSTAPKQGSVTQFIDWADQAPCWSADERAAAKALITNYVGVILPKVRSSRATTDIREIAGNWEQSLRSIDFDLGWLD